MFQCMKVKNVFPLGTLIKDAWKIYENEKDVGPVMMSHFFLILGLSYPVWFADNSKFDWSFFHAYLKELFDKFSSSFGTIERCD